MDKKWLLGVEQNLSEKQMEIERMQMELDAQKAQLDSQTAQELAARLNTLYKEYASLKQQVSIICSNEQAYEKNDKIKDSTVWLSLSYFSLFLPIIITVNMFP